VDVPTIGAGIAASILSFIGGAVRTRTSRETRFEERVDKRLVELEGEVAECRKRDRQYAKVEIAVRLMVPEILRIDRGNPVLSIVATTLNIVDGGEPETMEQLIAKLKEIP
jgi:hypothetical protein